MQEVMDPMHRTTPPRYLTLPNSRRPRPRPTKNCTRRCRSTYHHIHPSKTTLPNKESKSAPSVPHTCARSYTYANALH